MEVHETRLANGIRVVTAGMPRVESVSVGIWVGVGSRYELKKHAGISHFAEHMLFKGTKKRASRDITRAIEGRGGYLNAFTQSDNTVYYARVAYDHAMEALDVLADMYLNSRIDELDVEKERGVIIEEIMMYRDQPHQRVQDMLGEALWVRHPLGRPISGYPKTVAGIMKSDLQEFIRRRYVPENTIVSFAGRVDHGACVAQVSRHLGRHRKSGRPTFRGVNSKVCQEKIVLEARDTEQTHLAMGVRIFGRKDKRRFALKTLSVILGENMSSRLFQTVREKNGLAYSVHSGVHLFDETGVLAITAGLERKRHRKAIRLIAKELERLKNVRVGSRELGRAKDYAIGQLRLALENTATQMTWIAENLMFRGRFISPEEIIGFLQAVTADDVQGLARRIFRPQNISVAMVSPGLGEDDRKVLQDRIAIL